MDIDPLPLRRSSTPFIYFDCVCGSKLHAYSVYHVASEHYDPDNYDPQTFAESLRCNRPLPDPYAWYVYKRQAAIVNIVDLQAFNQSHDHSHEPVPAPRQTCLARLTMAQIDSYLIMYKYQEEEEEESEICAVCHAEFEKNQFILEVDCKHRFHMECIREWLLRKNECPICRRPALNM